MSIPHYWSVQQLLQSRLFSIVGYQREYKCMQENNVDELLSDLQLNFQGCCRAGDDNRVVRKNGEYFLGSVIVSSIKGRSCLEDCVWH